MNGEIRLPNNKYIPKDLKSLLPERIPYAKFQDYNFWFLFNYPFAERDRHGKLKIRINEDIEKFAWDNNFIETLQKRRNDSLNHLKQKGYQCESITLELSFRMIIGLGATHPQETSMTLHHIYGIPYIPGSAIKGVTRHWAILKFAEGYSNQNNEKNFEKAIDKVEKSLENCDESLSPKIIMNDVEISFPCAIGIFGTQKEQGKVIFFDAYPTENLKLKIDIMNPHYPEYYSGSQPPADWQSPRPIKFLTVDKNTNFNFNLASKDQNLLKKAKSLLENALKEFGIGAKTRLGYGVFE